MKFLIALAVFSAASIILALLNRAPADPLQGKIFRGSVRHVVDGDSLYLDGLEPQIRLWGVDAPEKGEHGYDRAKRHLVDLVQGRLLSCDQKDLDKYGRIVARCYLVGGREVNRAMIESGTAREYMRFTKGFYGGKN